MQFQRVGDMNAQTGVVLDIMNRLSLKQYDACTLVETYWDNLRAQGELPLRAQIDPRGIEDALNYAFILESIGAGHARVRIAGMHLNELMGMEVRGMPISSFITPASREAFARVLVSLLNSPAKMQLSLQAEGTALEARLLLLPLQDDEGQVNRILGCFETKGSAGAAPHRFSLVDVKKTPVGTASRAKSSCQATDKECKNKPYESDSSLETPLARAPYLKLVQDNG
ncbi:PAS domain-containing protein [Lentibacter sp. XHP0401]|uniref:PAS domain-containing protein n=1 Tax=Lentibacter sp. XHP0401 TaxID=2984334 RepID=UPI0021E79806|nr:PAS domain-containing protein [Lentibacter sp. XHP0401]MCV2892369.1 PAS domain-containing protein [Lentibacter sp. XHP0401]